MIVLPRLEIDLSKLSHNAHTLVERLGNRGISVTAVTKAVLGSPLMVTTLLDAGVKDVADSRVENIEAMHLALISTTMTLIRSPMLSQAARVVSQADISCNTEIKVIKELSREAQKAGVTHGVILMVELGDLREGIMPDQLMDAARETLACPNIELKGIGTNLACRSGVVPDENNMAVLSQLANTIETELDVRVGTISGGNSANLDWALGDAKTGRINNLRLGESIFLGCETLHRRSIDGLHTDAFTLCAEIIEAKIKPSKPTGAIAQGAFGEVPLVTDRGMVNQLILAIGRQDIDPLGLQAPAGINIMGASSDHLILESSRDNLGVGAQVDFQMNYSTLVRAMTSPFVTKVLTNPLPTQHMLNSVEC